MAMDNSLEVDRTPWINSKRGNSLPKLFFFFFCSMCCLIRVLSMSYRITILKLFLYIHMYLGHSSVPNIPMVFSIEIISYFISADLLWIAHTSGLFLLHSLSWLLPFLPPSLSPLFYVCHHLLFTFLSIALE